MNRPTVKRRKVPRSVLFCRTPGQLKADLERLAADRNVSLNFLITKVAEELVRRNLKTDGAQTVAGSNQTDNGSD